MDDRKFRFLKAVLGEDGAKALAKAAERAPELEAALLPRSIMAWLGLTTRADFEGRIPGNENTYVQFTKSESRYSGTVTIGEEVYSFENASVMHLGACVAVALGADHERVSPTLRDLDIQRLGKNIDTLAKARVAISELKKKAMGAQGGQEAPGPAAAPKEPGAPTPPAAPELKQTIKGPTVGIKPKLPKPPKPSTPSLLPEAQKLPGQKGNRPQLKVTKSQADHKCPICAGTQFKAEKFTGCICFRDLAKSVKVTVVEDGYSLEFKSEWDQESILTLAESMGKK
jgi:hypothetical protein